jgi:hypothetical protein
MGNAGLLENLPESQMLEDIEKVRNGAVLDELYPNVSVEQLLQYSFALEDVCIKNNITIPWEV